MESKEDCLVASITESDIAWSDHSCDNVSDVIIVCEMVNLHENVPLQRDCIVSANDQNIVKLSDILTKEQCQEACQTNDDWRWYSFDEGCICYRMLSHGKH